MKATYSGEFIHMIFVELSTIKDGNAIMFVSVDNYSLFCFSNAFKAPLTFENLSAHLDGIIDNIREHHPGIIPTFIMGYGESMQFKLALHYKGKANFRFSEAQANEIARPV